MNVNILTLEEIQNIENELKARKTELKGIELLKLRTDAIYRINYIKKHADIILPLIEHERSSCSDDNICNGYGSADYGARCKKCHLLEILNGDYDAGDFYVDFDIIIRDVDQIIND